MARLQFRVEATKSRTGIHAERRLVLVFKPNGVVQRIMTGTERDKGTYSKGSAWKVEVSLDPGDVAVYVRLVRGPRGVVTGWFEVYNSQGEQVFRAVLRRRKVRASRGDPSYAGYVEKTLEVLGMDDYVRRVNWSTAG